MHHFLSSYGLAGHRPPAPTPPWLTEAASIPELAQRISVPPETLVATIARWNAHAAAGVDPDFHRGESHHDRAWGDHPGFGLTPRATIGPLDSPPYYAIRVMCGTLGTKGGPRTDEVQKHPGRVVDIGNAFHVDNVERIAQGVGRSISPCDNDIR